MPKKSTRPAKSSQQRAREEQWRRRVSAQGLATIDGPATTTNAPDFDENADEQAEPELSTSTMTTVRARDATPARSNRATSAAVQQRRTPTAAAARASRLRPAANSLSIDEEMYYVRTDIRRLVILTAICFAVLIALSFVIN